MNKEFLKYRVWKMQTKLCYGFDSVAFISTTKSSDRSSAATVYGRCQALKSVLNKTMKNVKVVNQHSYYEGNSLRVYFNVSDKESCDALLNITSKNTHNFELLEVKTPKNQAHLDMINNKEITQVIRKQIYYGKYVYSVKIILDSPGFAPSNSGFAPSRHNERMKRASQMQSWINNAMPDNSSSVWWDEIQLFTNDVTALMMFRLTFDVKSCTIKEAILLETEDSDPEHEMGILI